jgi:hypothetical protein
MVIHQETIKMKERDKCVKTQNRTVKCKILGNIHSGGARGGQGGNCPRAPAGGGRQKRVVKNFFDGLTSEGGDRGVARGQQLSYSFINGFHKVRVDE